MIEGKVWKFRDNIDTDQIIPSQYLLLPTIEEMKKYTFEPINKNFSQSVQNGDLIIAGENFGSGSSREQAPRVLKELGIQVIIAKSFARIFFRNSINIGLPVIICKEIYDATEQGDCVLVDMEKGIVQCKNSQQKFTSTKLSTHIMTILNSKGLINYLNER